MSSAEASTTRESPVETSHEAPTFDEPVQCTGAAPPPPMQAPPAQASTTICRFWMEGYCFRGALCWYKHSHDAASTSFADATDGAGEVVGPPQGTSSKPKSPTYPTTRSLNAHASAFSPATAPSAADQVAEHGQDAPLFQQGQGQSGEGSVQVIPGTCLRPTDYSWRKGEDAETPNVLSGVNKRCPMCREGPGKTLVIQKYKDTLSRKPCNFFEATKTSPHGPFCKFGDDCHYAHILTPGDDRYLFGGGFELMSAKARERRERREAQRRRRRPFYSGPLGLTEAEVAELDYLRFFDVMVSNGNDPADWDRDGSASPPRRAPRRYSDAGTTLRFPRFDLELGQRDLNVHAPPRRTQGNEPVPAGLRRSARLMGSLGTPDVNSRTRTRMDEAGPQVRSADAAHRTFFSSTRSDRRAAQRRYRREALQAEALAQARAQARDQSGASASGDTARDSTSNPNAATVANGSAIHPHESPSPEDSFELVGEEDNDEDDPASPSGQLFNLARAFEEGYERGGRWEVDDEDEHNEHSHESRIGLGADDDDDDQTGWSTDESDFQYRVGPGGSIWFGGEEIFAGEYGSIWDDENDGHIWYYE
ncbi:hypothetical protein BCV69DRAFT_277638 [Microstroma glucosiphilum]|uniref:C3H1-type domain-containing protein n=1 Tax=Pseudomicrostroma glucosiphilum TaxID=1684307 RepID=A0A316U586_9BASI|nr:hypothetical protein BCV69DRAFT_277638 [Pseudomicrostroma glucosiphilum]PWN20399.1 hypothetical protein BCV69DRAFT_277638 [Pseudomicrostroma glucosiphilum]